MIRIQLLKTILLFFLISLPYFTVSAEPNSDPGYSPSHSPGYAPGYSQLNSKGKKYYLYKKEIPLKNSDKIQTIYFFAKSPDNKKGIALSKVPDDRIVSETKNGLLVLKKKPIKIVPPKSSE